MFKLRKMYIIGSVKRELCYFYVQFLNKSL